MILHDPFFWFTLVFGLFFLLQVIAVAVFIGPAYRTYRTLKRMQAHPYNSRLREKLGPVR